MFNGFNIKRYDLRILHLIITGGDPSDVHALSKAIIDNDRHTHSTIIFIGRSLILVTYMMIGNTAL